MEYIYAFAIGGAFCLIAQLLIDLTKLTPARILVLYVCSGVTLTAVGLYPPLAEFAGCGATVPLTGFGYCLANGVKVAVNEKGMLGAFTGGLSATAAGISAALCFSLAAAAIFRASPRGSYKKSRKKGTE